MRLYHLKRSFGRLSMKRLCIVSAVFRRKCLSLFNDMYANWLKHRRAFLLSRSLALRKFSQFKFSTVYCFSISPNYRRFRMKSENTKPNDFEMVLTQDFAWTILLLNRLRPFKIERKETSKNKKLAFSSQINYVIQMKTFGHMR